jgi:hypothetical protein
MARTESAEFAVRLCEAGYDWGPFNERPLISRQRAERSDRR